MPGYLGSKQLYRNHFGARPVREIYWQSNKVMGFVDASYIADEVIGEKMSSNGKLPSITCHDTSITVMTNNYESGYCYTKYYCDHIKINFLYGGGATLFDCNGNVIIDISGTVSFNYLTAKWTIGSKCTAYGQTLFDTSNTGRDLSSGWVTYEIYYDSSSQRWVVLWNGGTYTSNQVDWCPTYARVMPQLWIMPGYDTIYTYNGAVYILYMNKAVGYKNAR